MHDLISEFFENAVRDLMSPMFMKPENVANKPITGEPWLKYQYIPAKTISGSVGVGTIVYRGIVQLDVNVPADTGPGLVGQIASKIEDAFPIGSEHNVGSSKLSVLSVSRGVSRDDPVWYTVPVSIFWSLHKLQ